MAESPALIASQPGIKRDGTKFEGNNYTDGLWCRFQRGKPKKIGGYQQVTDTVPEITRGMHSFSADDIQYLHLGHPDTVGQYLVSNGTLSTFNDRTPAGFVTSVNNLWQFALFNDISGTGSHVLVVHGAPNLANIDNSVGANIYIGTVTAAAIFSITGLSVDAGTGWNTGTPGPLSGGIVTSGQYLFGFGSDGIIRQSAINDLGAIPVEFNLGTQKIVRGFPLRGAGTGPAVLMWALDSLIRGTFQVSGPPDFAFDIIATDISIMSSQGVVEADGIFYWPGVDRWYMFNGVVREIPNDINQNFFFDNINFANRQKCFGFRVPRFGEIWWCFPKGGATECTHAVIYNIREGSWYDTELPDQDDLTQGRTAGIFANVYQRPFMVDNEVTANGRTLWQHETAFDKIRTSSVDAVRSFFETHELSMLEAGQAEKAVRVARIEPDFVQVGDMTLTVRGRANTKAPQITETPKTFVATPTTGTDETIKLKTIQRLMSFRFESNVQGGNYELGDTYAHIEPADGRVES